MTTARLFSTTLRRTGFAVVAATLVLTSLVMSHHPAGATGANGVMAVIPGASDLTVDPVTHNAYVTSSDGHVREVTPSGTVTVLNPTPFSAAATSIVLDASTSTLYVGVAGSPGSVWSLPEAGGTASGVATLGGSLSPTGLAFAANTIVVATGAGGIVTAYDTSGNQLGACPTGTFGPETTDLVAVDTGSSIIIVVVDSANSTAYLSEPSGTCAPVGQEVIVGGANSVGLIPVGSGVLLFGTPTGIAVTDFSSSPTSVAVQPDVTAIELGSLVNPFYWMLDGGQNIRRVTTPGPVTNVVATPGDASATISWMPPSDMGGFAEITYEVSVVGDSSKKCTTTSTSCTISGLTNGATYRFLVSEFSLGSPGGVRSNAVTPSAPSPTTSTPNTSTTTPSGSLAATGSSTADLMGLGVFALLFGGLLIGRRRISRV